MKMPCLINCINETMMTMVTTIVMQILTMMTIRIWTTTILLTPRTDKTLCLAFGLQSLNLKKKQERLQNTRASGWRSQFGFIPFDTILLPITLPCSILDRYAFHNCTVAIAWSNKKQYQLISGSIWMARVSYETHVLCVKKGSGWWWDWGWWVRVGWWG